MDDAVLKVLKKIIKDEIGDMVHEEIKLQFEPLKRAMSTVINENRKYHDNVSRQISEDRKDISKITIDTAKGIAQNKVIIDNQNNAEEKLVKAVKEEAEKVPERAEKAVEKMFDKQPFLRKLRDRYFKKEV